MVIAFVTRTLVCCDYYIHRLCVRFWFQSSSRTQWRALMRAPEGLILWLASRQTHDPSCCNLPLITSRPSPPSLSLEMLTTWTAMRPSGRREMLRSMSSLIYSFTSGNLEQSHFRNGLFPSAIQGAEGRLLNTYKVEMFWRCFNSNLIQSSYSVL